MVLVVPIVPENSCGSDGTTAVKTTVVGTIADSPKMDRDSVERQDKEDQDLLKKEIQNSLANQVVLTDLYYDSGVIQGIVRAGWFEQLTMLVIFSNSLWIGYDAEFNTKGLLIDADIQFQVAENLFCLFFSIELALRFLAMKKKSCAYADAWFAFDSVLVFFMVWETWVMTLIVIITGGGGVNIGGLAVLRLLRLCRLTRMAKLMRAIPELLVLFTAMVASARSVLLTMTLLAIVIYVFAVLLTELLGGTDVGKESFKSVKMSMFTLLIEGVDGFSLLEHVDFIFEDMGPDREERDLTFDEFMRVILLLREGNPATVRDVTELRKFAHSRFTTIEEKCVRGGGFAGRPSIRGYGTNIDFNAPLACSAADVVEIEQSFADAGVSGAPGGNDASAFAVIAPSVRSEISDLRLRMKKLEELTTSVVQAQGLLLGRLQAAPVAASTQLGPASPSRALQPPSSPWMRCSDVGAANPVMVVAVS